MVNKNWDVCKSGASIIKIIRNTINRGNILTPFQCMSFNLMGRIISKKLRQYAVNSAVVRATSIHRSRRSLWFFMILPPLQGSAETFHAH